MLNASQIEAPFLQFERYGVMGAGMSGLAAARLLLRLGKSVTIFDDHADAANDGLASIARLGTRLALGADHPGLEGLQAIVTSPGVAIDHPVFAEAGRLGLPIRGELELGALCAGAGRMVAITGTNGKTTVTMLVRQLCETAGLPSIAAGNIGYPLCDAVMKGAPEGDRMIYSVEVSSFQLETVERFTPEVAVILNITPDHLDRHHTMEEYARMKQRVTDGQGPEQVLVVNQDDPYCLAIAAQARARVLRFSLERPVPDGAWLDGDLIVLQQSGRKPHRLMAMCDLKMIGLHNVANAMAVACVGMALGLPQAAIAETLTNFRAAPHRLELVGSKNGIQFIDDSKATNLGAMIKAIESFNRGIHLIAGGRDKASPFDTVTGLLAERVHAIYLIGEAAEPMRRAWGDRVECVMCGTLDKALEAAAARAADSEVVLLAPGCASFDQFRSYAHRGEVFAQWVRNYLSQSAGGEALKEDETRRNQ